VFAVLRGSLSQASLPNRLHEGSVPGYAATGTARALARSNAIRARDAKVALALLS